MSRLSRILPVAMVLCGFLMAGCHQGEVKLYKRKSGGEQVWVGKLDPDIYKDHEKRLELSVKVATISDAVSLTPGIAMVNKFKANWDGNVQALLARYAMLINDHNTRHISLEEYWQRRNDLDQLLVDLAFERPQVQNQLNEFYEYWKVQSDEAFANLDAELRKKAGEAAQAKEQEVKAELDRLSKKIDDINERMRTTP